MDTVIGSDGWTHTLALNRALDAVVSTTALHYLGEPTLVHTHRRLAALLRPGGALVNGDHFPQDGPHCSHLTAHVGRRRAERLRAFEHEDWEAWWSAAAQDPELADLFAERGQRQSAHGNEGGSDNCLTLARHTELLRQAGLQRTTPVSQFGDSHVLVAVKD